MAQMSDVKLGKTMSYLLRHGAIEQGINIDYDGYVNVDDILRFQNLKGTYTLWDVRRVVFNDKQRFRLKQSWNGVYVKANEGHTFHLRDTIGKVRTYKQRFRWNQSRNDIYLRARRSLRDTNHKQSLRLNQSRNDAYVRASRGLTDNKGKVETDDKQGFRSRNDAYVRASKGLTDNIGKVETDDKQGFGSRNDASRGLTDNIGKVETNDKQGFGSRNDDYVSANEGPSFGLEPVYDQKLIKMLLYYVRYGASKYGLHMDSDGYVDVNEMLLLPIVKRRCTVRDIRGTVNGDPFKRCHLKYSNNRIYLRANPGIHPFNPYIDPEQMLKISEASDLPVVLRGSYLEKWNSIKTVGLCRQQGKYIYLASGLPDEKAVARGVEQIYEIYIYIDVEKAISAGIVFHKLENGVVLTPGDEQGFLSPLYFSRVVEAITGEEISVI